MDRFHKPGFLNGLPPIKAVGLLALMVFVLFVSFRIFTPPTKTVQILAAPDGSREARLQHVYYTSKPGYKIATRKNRLWRTVLYLPEYTNAPPTGDLKETLRWSEDSGVLFFDINGRPVWSYNVE